jgi:hypothetical protein
MSVNVGDSYACPDPECGCAIEVRTASGAVCSKLKPSRRKFLLRSRGGPSLAAPDNFGSQEATGEGVFGTAGGGSATTQGRYGSSSSSAHSSLVAAGAR